MAINDVIQYIRQIDPAINASAVTKINIPEEGCPQSLCFAVDQPRMNLALEKQCPLILVPKHCVNQRKQSVASQIHALDSFPYHQAKILEAYARPANTVKARILSDLPEDIELGKNVSIGAHVVLGKRVVLEDGVTLVGQVYVGDDCVIQANTLVYPQVYIGCRTRIGRNCIIHNNSSIGADGFGFTADLERGGILKVHQVGRVEIGDGVEIGSQCAIDRGAIGATRIGNHTKLDNFVHIAHNVQIGEYGLITAGLIIAGSSTIGDRFRCGGRTSITEHVHICDDVTLAGVSVVTNDINKPGAYGGHPLQPMPDYLRTQASVAKLPKIRKQLNELVKRLAH